LSKEQRYKNVKNMKLFDNPSWLTRRDFFRTLSAIGLGAFLAPLFPTARAQEKKTPPPGTNIADALKHPRVPDSMPGKYPGKVVRVNHEHSVTERNIDPAAVKTMLTEGMLALTGASSIREAWRQFVAPGERIGLKVNPVAGKDLSTSRELVREVIAELTAAGVPQKDILIWDRREQDLEETGFTTENFPGIRIKGTEFKSEGSFTDKDGKYFSESRIDKEWFYWADVEGSYDAETMPYMVNGGKYSYFSSICTKEVDKIINLPILKNAGASVTLCLKNLAYGTITNTGRLHKELWSETSAQVCAFPPLRDKVVLNIVDGLIGCYQGGPGVNQQYITDFKCLLLGTDPVAVDRIGYDIVYKKRVAEGIQKEETEKGRKFLALSQELGLGEADIEKITLVNKDLS
jgi:hypothetical protein